MRLADGIRKHGFRKWYERELMQSHAHLLLTFLCLFGVFAAFEAYGLGAAWSEQAFDLVSILLCAGVGLWALRRYLFFLNHAETAANQADCPECKAYGRFSVESESQREGRLLVCCRKCNHRWTIVD